MKAETALANGKAAEIFGQMVTAQGGPVDFMENYNSHLTLAPVVKAVPASREGYVDAMDARAVGMAVVALGGGRVDPTQKIDHSVGITQICQCGDQLAKDEPLAMVYAADEAAADEAIARVQAAISLADTKPAANPVTAEIIRG